MKRDPQPDTDPRDAKPPVRAFSDPTPPGNYLTASHGVAAGAGLAAGLAAVWLWNKYRAPGQVADALQAATDETIDGA